MNHYDMLLLEKHAEAVRTRPRKIIQVSYGTSDIRGGSIVALCDDGTLWDFDFQYMNWRKLPDIPQGEYS
jgi:hypothetical protein